MTIKQYFTNRNEIMGIEMSSSQLDTFILSVGLVGTDLADGEAKTLDTAYLGVILVILVRPDIAEDNYSIKYDRGALVRWYRYETSRLGLPDDLTLDDKVVDKSYLH